MNPWSRCERRTAASAQQEGSRLEWPTVMLCNEMMNNWQNHSWLVVSTPLKTIGQMRLLFPIYGKIKNVPNHQPDRVAHPTGGRNILMTNHSDDKVKCGTTGAVIADF